MRSVYCDIMKYLINWIIYAGYTFLALVSVAGAFREEDVLWRWLLFASAVISLALAISRLRSKRRMEEKILELEENKQDKLVFASEDTCESIIDELE